MENQNTNNMSSLSLTSRARVGLHNLKTAWRNLLKYKTQNIISIACLAVGVVCFAVVFQVGTSYLRNLYYTKYDTGRPIFHLYEMTE